ncbi:MAG: CBS domain-containing protein [Proteobacteria bacterium]|nr:CBS domain-containing protein [Pseudomonadota bacterium]
MKIADVMSRDVQIANPNDSIQSVAQKMAELDVGALPVCDGRRIQGMVTDRDIAVRGVAQGLENSAPISRIMTGNLEYVLASDDLNRAADKMADHQIRRLPVVDENKDLVGIISLGDLAQEHRAKIVGRTLEEISEPGGSGNQTTA